MSFHKNHIELIGTVTVGPKGQVVIPVEARDRMNIVAGDKLIALYVPDNDAIGFVSEQSMQGVIERMGRHVEALKGKLNKGK